MQFLSLSIGLLYFGIHAATADNSTILSPTIDTFINNLLTEWKTPGGVGVAVVRMSAEGRWLVETKGYGVAKADGTSVTPDTIFSLGSNSKLFDILATGLLISNQSLSPQISWTTKMTSMLPDWKLMDPVASSESTIIDLMSHRTGLPRHDESYFVKNETLRALVRRLRYLKPSAGFRETFQYNNMMYAVLSYLPTTLLPHKPPFERYVTDNIIDPLGLNSTTYSFAAANGTGRMADGFFRLGTSPTDSAFDAGTLKVPYILNGETFFGPGGVLSTAVDAARWLQMLILNGQHPTTNATIIPSSVIQMVATGVTVSDGNADAPELSPLVYGGGQVQSSYRGHVMIEHGGDVPGFHSQITRFPADGVGIAVLTNDDYGVLMKEVIKFRIIDEIFGPDPVDWDSRYKAAIQAIYAAPPSTPAPPNASLPLPFAAMQGAYRNRGYGRDIMLCAPATPAQHCRTVLADLNNTFPTALATADLLWAWDRLDLSYVTLTHFDGAVFNLTSWVVAPTGNASAPLFTYGPTGGSVVVEFAVQKGKVAGFGISGGFWGAGDSVGEPKGITVEARSEVWFDALGV
ncbi:beta-lactamase/transpeptidase-like protein [Mycena albidolilacea]|uniref:Beta-lactamase/transpeptidase-like protein n=1 Tax=Mycena albidolilacea TaxID=1033008 RepID=A0AAD7A368_9AGAR|nr:beta-lactamase/transpeptidase-like protein [Mycena albidolilacea]